MPAVHHMVLLQFKPEISPSRITELFAQLAELRRKISGITYLASGPYSSPEGMNQGYTHGFLVTFESPAARDAYLTHPDHERVKTAFLASLDGAVAFDFEA